MTADLSPFSQLSITAQRAVTDDKTYTALYSAVCKLREAANDDPDKIAAARIKERELHLVQYYRQARRS